MIKPSELLRSREICPNLPEGIHKIAERIAQKTKAESSISPQELALLFLSVLEEELLPNFELFPQLVDKIVQKYVNGDDYSTIFRKICQDLIGIDTPFIVEEKEYPENINVAVDWWTKAILFRTDVAGMPIDFQKLFRRQYTPAKIALFKSTLASEIQKSFANQKEELWLNSDWTADVILERAGNKISIHPLLGYPNATMAIYSDEVKVSVDGGHTWEQIYYKE